MGDAGAGSAGSEKHDNLARWFDARLDPGSQEVVGWTDSAALVP